MKRPFFTTILAALEAERDVARAEEDRLRAELAAANARADKMIAECVSLRSAVDDQARKLLKVEVAVGDAGFPWAVDDEGNIVETISERVARALADCQRQRDHDHMPRLREHLRGGVGIGRGAAASTPPTGARGAAMTYTTFAVAEAVAELTAERDDLRNCPKTAPSWRSGTNG